MMIIKAHKTPKFNPYKGKSKEGRGIATLKIEGKQSGCYAIFIRGVLKYIGTAEKDVKKTAYRHFQVWDDEKYRETSQHAHKRKSYVRYKFEKTTFLKIWYTKTKAQAKELEKYLIMKLKPVDNDVLYQSYLFQSTQVEETNLGYSEEPPF